MAPHGFARGQNQDFKISMTDTTSRIRTRFAPSPTGFIHLRNILSARGYESLDAVRKEGIDAGRKEGMDAGRKEGMDAGRKEGMDAGAVAARRAVLFLLLENAAIEPTADDRARVERCEDIATIDAWILRTRTARRRDEVFDAAR